MFWLNIWDIDQLLGRRARSCWIPIWGAQVVRALGTILVTPEAQISILEANLARQLQWIGAADAKSNFIFTVSVAMMGVLAAVAPKIAVQWSPWQVVFCSLAVASICATIICAANAVFPRTEGPIRSVIYCGSIAGIDLKRFRERIGEMALPEYADDLMVQCYRNAAIANRKFAWVKRGLSVLYVSAIPWVLATWLLYSRSST